MKQSPLYMLKQSCLRVWDVPQSIFTTCKRPCLASLTLAKKHPILYMINTNRSSFYTSRHPRVKQDGSFVIESWCKKIIIYGLLPRSEYMECVCCTYIHIQCIHKYTYSHVYILTHKVNCAVLPKRCSCHMCRTF